MPWEHDTKPLIGYLYERTSPEWNQATCDMPAEGSYVARCDPLAHESIRHYYAVIQVAPGSKFWLRVLTRFGDVVYEKLLDSVVDSWLLMEHKFFYIESYTSG